MALFEEISFGKFNTTKLREGYIATLQAQYKKTGGHFFDKDTMAFFNSKVEPKAIEILMEEGVPSQWVFVTSEQFEDRDYVAPRYWSVRHWNGGRGMDTINEFQEFDNVDVAMKAAKAYAEGLVA